MEPLCEAVKVEVGEEPTGGQASSTSQQPSVMDRVSDHSEGSLQWDEIGIKEEEEEEVCIKDEGIEDFDPLTGYTVFAPMQKSNPRSTRVKKKKSAFIRKSFKTGGGPPQPLEDTGASSVKVNDIKLKWKNMRDSMLKSLQTKSGDCASKKKKYVHFEALTFLRTSAEKRSTSSNYEDDNTADPDPDESAILDDEDDSLMSTSSIDPPESRRKGVFKKPSQPSKITPFQASLISSLDQATKTLQSPKNDPEDADKSYLMSLLPDYKNLTTAKKWEFRTYVANFFQNVYLTSPPTTSQQFYSQNYYQPQWRGGDQQQFCSNTNTSYSASSSPTGSVASPCIPSPNPQ